MKKKNKFWIYPLIITMGFILMLANSCKKDNKGQVPVLTTASVSNISYDTASCGGGIVSEGTATITTRGLCWSTNTTPTIIDSKNINGAGAGQFTSSITGLSPSTKYYVRAYATNSVGTGYGNAMSFTTEKAQVPILTTHSMSNITSTTATCGGNITVDGGSAVIARGVCWSTSSNPTVSLSTKTVDGIGTGSYSSNLTGLLPGTIYYVRAYATNAVGTIYGVEQIFTTINYATLTTNNVSNITLTTAICGGNITTDGGSAVTARGVCWSTSNTPTVSSNSKTINGTGTGSFTSILSGLTAFTTYYVRAYASNGMGIAYGDQVNFTTLLNIGDSYQGGKVAYILHPDDPGYIAGQTHGLIAAANDQSTGINWYNGYNTTTGATGLALGTGKANTNTIITSQGLGTYAAKLCADLLLNGYTDWYLPSKDELNKLYINRQLIGGFTNSLYGYWSSSEVGNNIVWGQTFNGGYQIINDKNSILYVRAIRSF
jgi:hypothetical protein